MKRFTYTFALITILISSSFLTSCTADEIVDESKNEVIINQTTAVDPPVVPDRPK